MSVDEVKTMINEIVGAETPDLAKVASLVDCITADYNARDEALSRVTSLEDEKRQLQDTNMKLFLQVTGDGGSGDAEPDELEGEAAVDAFWDKLLNEKDGD